MENYEVIACAILIIIALISGIKFGSGYHNCWWRDKLLSRGIVEWYLDDKADWERKLRWKDGDREDIPQ